MGSGWSSYTPHALFTPGISWSPWWHCFTLTAQILLYSPLSARPACRCCISRFVIFNKWLSLFASVSCGLIRLWTSGGKKVSILYKCIFVSILSSGNNGSTFIRKTKTRHPPDLKALCFCNINKEPTFPYDITDLIRLYLYISCSLCQLLNSGCWLKKYTNNGHSLTWATQARCHEMSQYSAQNKQMYLVLSPQSFWR